MRRGCRRRRRLLSRSGLGGLLLLHRIMVPDRATSRGTKERVVPGDMAGHAAHSGACGTTSPRGGWRSKRCYEKTAYAEYSERGA